ncbi:hypothetical protein PLICRDRAFT_49682 [Plicaturopsis crispa FD-325 SS-3]|nr:hypothetical protein PLICRDRAFT_49682 [Plicaturopsis crispa FD-325 SS-3]
MVIHPLKVYVTGWLNQFIIEKSIIKCEFLGSNEIVQEVSGVPLPKPKRGNPNDDPHPGTIPQPSIRLLSPSDFDRSYITFVNEIVKSYNWHVHNATCWKYLKGGPPKKQDQDKHCRMRMNGCTNELTYIDEETKSIVLRRFHPRIAAYNDLVIFLLQCNIDLKFIGSGEAAKALLYYVTDYITKPSLPAHIGLAALQYAIKKTATQSNSVNIIAGEPKKSSALVTIVNGLMGRQEISHQQVMSYLIGGGDHYKSENFVNLYWTPYLRLFDNWYKERPYTQPTTEENIENHQQNSAISMNLDEQQSQPQHSLESLDRDTTNESTLIEPEGDTEIEVNSDTLNKDEQVILTLGNGSITAMNQQYDYIYRTSDLWAESMCLYDFVGCVTKDLQYPAKIELKKKETTGPVRC